MQQPDPNALLASLRDPHLCRDAMQLVTAALPQHKTVLYPHLHAILDCIQPLLRNHTDQTSTKATQLLTLIISSFQDSTSQQLLKIALMNQIVTNLGNPSESSLRKVSHLFLLRYCETYKNFDGLMFHYLEGGLKENSDWMIQQKAINSFQSIFLLESKLVNWKSQYLTKIAATLMDKARHYNQQISKASSQTLSTIYKHKDAKQLITIFDDQNLTKLQNLMEQKLIVVQADIIETVGRIIFQRNNPPAEQEENPQNVEESSEEVLVMNKQQLMSAPVEAVLEVLLNQKNEISLRIDACQVLEETHLTDPSEKLSALLEENNLRIIKLLKEESVKFTSISLKLIQMYYSRLPSSSGELLCLIHSLLSKLSSNNPSTKTLLSEFIRDSVSKQKQNNKYWIQCMLQELSLANQFQKEEMIGLMIEMFQDKLNLPQLDQQQALRQLSKYVQEPKTRIKLRTFECLVLICLNYNIIQEGSLTLQKELSAIYYQIFVQRLNKTKNFNNNQSYTLNKIKQLKPLVLSKNKFQTFTQRSISNTMPLRNTFDTKNVQSPLNEGIERKSIDLPSKKNPDYRSTRKMEEILYKKKSSENQSNRIELPKLSKLRSFEPEINSSRGYDFRTSKSKLNVSRQSDFKSENYLTKQQLQPLPQFQSVYRSITSHLQDKEWKVQVQAINHLRRITQHHPDIITFTSASGLNLMVQNLVKAIQSQRSTLSKNGLLCLTEMIQKFTHLLDPSIEFIIDKLTKKSADANLFMNFQVKKCLNTMACCLTEYKVINHIAALKLSKSNSVKDTLIEMLHAIVKKQAGAKDVDKLSELLGYFLDEGFYDLRLKAKQSLNDLCDKVPGHQNKLKARLSEQSYQRLTSTKNQRSISVGPASMNSTASLKNHSLSSTNLRSKWSKHSRYSPQKVNNQMTPTSREQKEIQIIPQPKRIKRKIIKVSQFPSQFLELDQLLANCKDSDWRKRIESLKKVSDFVLNHSEIFPSHRLNTQYVDLLTEQINEHNNKVSINALQTLKSLITHLQPLIQNNISIISNCVFNLIGSNKTQHRSLSQEIFQLLTNSIDLNLLLQHWCFGCLFSIPRSREYLILKIIHSLKRMWEGKQELVVKHVIPMLDKLVDDKKSEIVHYTKQLAKQLHKLCGEQLLQMVGKKVEVLKLLKES